MAVAASNPRYVRIIEVGPRDGLQNISTNVPSATKIELIKRLYTTGLKTVEITSVVSPRAVPQLADAQHVLANPDVQLMIRNPELRAPVLVPNSQGLDRALRAGVREVAVFVSATEGFSQANTRCSVAEGLRRAAQVSKTAVANNVAVRGYISCIFADPFDGPTKHESVLKVVQELFRAGCYEVSLGDTLGVGTPAEVRSLLRYLIAQGTPLEKLAGHFHDTYGQAVANAWEAYQCGIRAFDSSVSGLGGCPFAPGAKGNVATEDLVYMFEQAGVHTGVHLEQLVEIGNWISSQLKMQNSSRAGVALSKKKPLQPPQQLPTVRPPSPKLTWTLIRDTGALQILRSGVTLKAILHRPRNGNALTQSMISDLTNLFETAATDLVNTRRIAITATGKFFCTGMDLAKNTSPVAQGTSEIDAQYTRLTRLFNAIHSAPQVTVAVINGPCFGGGVGLAFACDVRIASSRASFTLSEVTLGLCPATISKHIVREWGVAFVREAMLSARTISAVELHRLGVIAKVVPPTTSDVAQDNGVGEEQEDGLQQAFDTYIHIYLRHAAPKASSMAKELVELGWVHAGKEEQERGIKGLFDRMMGEEGEAGVGVKRFQAAGRKKIDWDLEGKEGVVKAKL